MTLMNRVAIHPQIAVLMVTGWTALVLFGVARTAVSLDQAYPELFLGLMLQGVASSMRPKPEQRLLELVKEIAISLVDDYRLVEVHAMRGVRYNDVIGARNAARHIVGALQVVGVSRTNDDQGRNLDCW